MAVRGATGGCPADRSRGRQRNRTARTTWQMLLMAALSAPALAQGVKTEPPAAAAASTTGITTTTTTTAMRSCVALALCRADPACAACVAAINATIPAHSEAAYTRFIAENSRLRASADLAFLATITSAPSCVAVLGPAGDPSGSASQSALVLLDALRDLNLEADCIAQTGVYVPTCAVVEAACAAEPPCAPCFKSVIEAKEGERRTGDPGYGSVQRALRSAACNGTRPAVKLMLIDNHCPFPGCAFLKSECEASDECRRCLALIRAGDGATAARACPTLSPEGTPASRALDDAVTFCEMRSEGDCGYWRQRCADSASCSSCLDAIDASDQLSASAMGAAYASAACAAAADDEISLHYLDSIVFGCAGVTSCRVAVAECVFQHPFDCAACLSAQSPVHRSSAWRAGANTDDDKCVALGLEYSFDTLCRPCAGSVHVINRVVLATSVVGGASAAACLAVVATIVAHGRDLVSMRDRIVVGLLLANAVYSAANAVPLNALLSDVLNCGRLALSSEAIRVGRAWWFAGKYGLVAWELFILGASIRALLRGSAAVPPWAEAATHAACCATATAAFAVFYALCGKIQASGYNRATEDVALTNAYNHAGADDDLDDDQPGLKAEERFESSREAYDNLVREMLVAWDVLLGAAVVLWAALRLLYRRALRRTRDAEASVTRAQARDEWAATRQSSWKARRALLDAQREAFAEVARPLEPFIAVFVVFAVPAVVMSTSWCQARSGAVASGATALIDGMATSFAIGTCDVWCEFALAFRSLCTVAVYLAPRERRVDFVEVGVTCRKLAARVASCCLCRGATHAFERLAGGAGGGGYDDDDDDGALSHEMTRVVSQPSSAGAGGGGAGGGGGDESWWISESDISLDSVLGRGACGEVWLGRLRASDRPVAVKVLFSMATDEDGDQIDPSANEGFRKECAALQRLNSPHLIDFIGFGTAANGSGFIVTELMLGGSLESVLHDAARELPWRTRASVGLQVALGMSHLHSQGMVHRDLKSANVLLDGELRVAKVCDFGLVRATRPARSRVVYSPFTGVARRVPEVHGVGAAGGGAGTDGAVEALSHAGLTLEDASGAMTKAQGTLLWMAPEVFRGDTTYGPKVDVFSFGIVLWELAVRSTPWRELDSSASDAVSDGEETSPMHFFSALARALQTGRRPAIPADVAAAVPAGFAATMSRCWAGDPADRPPFSRVASVLAACLRGIA